MELIAALREYYINVLNLFLLILVLKVECTRVVNYVFIGVTKNSVFQKKYQIFIYISKVIIPAKHDKYEEIDAENISEFAKNEGKNTLNQCK